MVNWPPVAYTAVVPGQIEGIEFSKSQIIAGVSNSTCSLDHMKTYKVTCGPHYNADATTAVFELTKRAFASLFPVKGIMNCRQIISSRLYLRINHF